MNTSSLHLLSTHPPNQPTPSTLPHTYHPTHLSTHPSTPTHQHPPSTHSHTDQPAPLSIGVLSAIGVNLKACNHFRLYNGKAAEAELKVLIDKGVNIQSNELIRHNMVVFSNGEYYLPHSYIYPTLICMPILISTPLHSMPTNVFPI